MGKLAVFKYGRLMMLIFQLVLSIFTFVGLFGGNVTPVGNTANAMLVYVLPLLIALNLLMIIYWAFTRKWYILAIPVITVLSCIPYMLTLVQPRPLSDDSPKAIKIATYNVALFGRETNGFIAQDILAEMKRQNVDICCLQEYSDQSGDKKNSDSYKEYFPYMAVGRHDMVVYSKYPIKDSKTIDFEETNNSAMWALLDVKGKKVKVFNVHLETTGFNRTLHVAGKMEMKGQNVEKNALLRAIYGNYTFGMMVRSGQAQIVANEVRNANEPCILCGDFNDVPYSYTYNALLGNMVDGFKECGSGWMYTYRGRKAVRIDYIFHDEGMTGVNYYKVPLTYSDHLPVFMSIEL